MGRQVKRENAGEVFVFGGRLAMCPARIGLLKQAVLTVFLMNFESRNEAIRFRMNDGKSSPGRQIL